MIDSEKLKTNKSIDKPVKAKLAIYIISMIVVLALLTTGIVMFFMIKKNNESSIVISGNDVNITATAKIIGMKENPVLDEIHIDKENFTGQQSWQNMNIRFEDKESIVQIEITITNNHETNAIDVLFDNMTTTNNIYIEQGYYLNSNDSEILPIINYQRILSGESCTYRVILSVKDFNVTASDTLKINIVCEDVYVEM